MPSFSVNSPNQTKIKGCETVNLKVVSTLIRTFLALPAIRPAGVLAVTVALVFSAVPYAIARDVNWGSLNLTPHQESQINRLENDWEKTHEEVNSRIEKDMGELKTALPSGDRQRIRQIQSRIMSNKMYLMNQSMDTFLKKQETLTPAQRMQLQKMLPCKGN